MRRGAIGVPVAILLAGTMPAWAGDNGSTVTVVGGDSTSIQILTPEELEARRAAEQTPLVHFFSIVKQGFIVPGPGQARPGAAPPAVADAAPAPAEAQIAAAAPPAPVVVPLPHLRPPHVFVAKRVAVPDPTPVAATETVPPAAVPAAIATADQPMPPPVEPPPVEPPPGSEPAPEALAVAAPTPAPEMEPVTPEVPDAAGPGAVASLPPPTMVQPPQEQDVAAEADAAVGDTPLFTGSVMEAEMARRAAAAHNVQPVPRLGPPYELVRTLQTLQDQMAEGSTQALVAQRTLRRRINQQFLDADPAVWQDRRNAAAAVTFVLSGGAPDILLRFAKMDPPPAVDEKLAKGVLAYIEGRETEARDQLADFDPFTLPPSMAGGIALAQAALAVRADPKKAMKLLDTARLLAPGTLVEEAALRRELFVADQMRMDDKLQSVVRQYLDRFRHSVYAGNFRDKFAAAMSHLSFDGSPEALRRIDEMLAQAEPPARCQLYLTVALAAVVNGKAKTGAYAADRAGALALDKTTNQARARLYRAASLAVDPNKFETAQSDFRNIDVNLLPAADRALYEVVAATIQNIQSATKVSETSNWVQVASLDGGPQPDQTLVMKQAQEAIDAADAVLKAAPK